MEKNSEKPLSFARRAIISLDLDGLSSPADPSPVRPSPRRHIKLPSPRPSSFLPKPHVPRDHDAVSKSSSIQDRGDDTGDPLFHPPDAVCDFGKIFEDVDNFILSLWSPRLHPPDPEEVSVEVAEKERDESDSKEEEEKEKNQETESAETGIEDSKTESEKTEEKDDTESAEKKTDATESAEKIEDSNTNKSEMDVVPECVTKFLDLVEGIVIGRYDSSDGRCRWNEVPEGDMLLLESIDRVSKTVVVLEESKSNLNHPQLFSRVGKIQHRAMSFLEEQLRSLLEESRVFPLPTNPDGGEDEADSDSQPERYPDYEDDVVWGIKSITSRMLYAGYEPECCHVYMIARQNALDDSVYKVMGFERTSMDDVQKLTWEVLEQNISTWIRTCEQCATVYFPGESRLIHDIFAEYPTITSWLYRCLVRTVLLHLLNFAESVSALKRSTEKLFKVLDMYETVSDTFLATGSLFPDQDLRNEATLARTRLGETAVAIFCELENSIRSETGKTPVPGGAVHPLTRYTMNYLNYACQYKETLEQVFANHSKFERSDSTSRPRHADPDGDATEAADENQTTFSIEIVRVMDMLDTNLETKSKLYKDIALSSVFMMHNGRYILQKIKKSPEIHQLMGDTWSRRRSTNLRNYHKVYQRETWNPLLGCLGHEGLMNGGKVVKPALKERFKSFNGLFEEIHKTQSTWVVSDEQMQTELRISISSLVIPAYRSFMGRFAQYLDPGRQTEKYIKFQPEDVEACIDDLFEGNAKKK